MRPEPPHGGGAPPAPFACPWNGCPGDACSARAEVRRVFVPVLCFLGLRCADAGHPPGLFMWAPLLSKIFVK